MYAHDTLHRPLAALLILVLLAACGSTDDAASDNEALLSATSAVEDTSAAAVSSQGCPLSEHPSVTYDAADLPLAITFQYPSGWTIQDAEIMEGRTVKISMHKPFEVDGSSLRLALELIQSDDILSKTLLGRTLAPRHRAGKSFKERHQNEKHGELQLDGETVTVARTITDSKVLYKTGFRGEDGYHTTSLHLWWDGNDLCKDEVLELGDEILKTFALR